MKIKYIFFLCLFFFSALNLWAETGKCSYLETDVGTSYVANTEKGSFGYYYNIELCKEFEPITEEVIKYVQSIKNFKGKSIREVTTDIGNTLCRGDFGSCGDGKSFSDRYKKACVTAREKAIQDVENDKKKTSGKTADKKAATISSTDEMYAFSINGCPALADNLLKRFKNVAEREATIYHGKIIESSSKKYLKKSYEYAQNLGNTMGTIMKKMSSVAQSFQGFTKQAYNTGVQIMS